MATKAEKIELDEEMSREGIEALRGCDLSNPTVRQNLTLTHPLFKESTVLVTEPIRAMLNVAEFSVRVRSRACFGAGSGAGKSHTLMAIKRYLNRELPQVAVFQTNMLTQQAPSIRGFFQHMLTSGRHPEIQGETYVLRNRLSNLLANEARKHGGNIIVTLIDEAQVMNIQDYRFLKDTGNILSKLDVSMVTILCGQEPDFENKRRQLCTIETADLYSRYVSGPVPFVGYSAEGDIESILRQIDEKEYPPNSGWTWTRFFMPQAWDAGFRLANETKVLYSLLLSGAGGLKTPFIFPARELYKAIRTFLVLAGMSDKQEKEHILKYWQEAIQHAGLETAMTLSNPLQ